MSKLIKTNKLNFFYLNCKYNLNSNKFYSVQSNDINTNNTDFYVRIDNIFYKFESASALNAMSIIQFMLFLRLNDKIKNANSYFEIPRFCYHHLLSIAANCRICLIEESGALKLVAACATFFKNKANYFTKNALVRNAREHVLEYLLINHPLDCPICDQGGECDLQDITKGYGMDLGRFFNKDKKAVIFKEFNKEFKNYFIKFKMTRCIHCTRCIRYFTEVLDISLLGLIQRGFSMKVSSFVETLYDAYALGNVIDICPVGAFNKFNNNYFIFNVFFCNKILLQKNINFKGALTSGSTEDKVRAWELIQKYTIDVFDNLGSDIRVDFSGSKFFRVIPKLNQEVNDSWISDITRFSYYGLKVQRLSLPYLKRSNNINKSSDFISLSWFEIINFIWKYTYLNKYVLFKNICFSSLLGIFSDAKSILSFKHFNYFLGTSNFDSKIHDNKFVNYDLRNQYLLNLTKINLKKIKYLLLLGVNLRLESPLFFIRVNQQKKNLLIFYFGFSLKVDKFINHVGLSIKSFFNFLEGKHYLSTLVQLDSVSSIYTVLGNSIMIREDVLDIINSLNFFKKQKNFSFMFGCFNQYLGRITSFELGVTPGISYYNKNASLSFNFSFFRMPLNFLFILNNVDDLNFFTNFLLNKNNIFSIFIGSHCFDHFSNLCDILLPVNCFSEKINYFLNNEGSLRVSNIIEFSPNKIKESAFFYSLFYKFYIEYLNVYSLNVTLDYKFFFNFFNIFNFKWFVLFLKKQFNLFFSLSKNNDFNLSFNDNFIMLKNFWNSSLFLDLKLINVINANTHIFIFIKNKNIDFIYKKNFINNFKYNFFYKNTVFNFSIFNIFFNFLFQYFYSNKNLFVTKLSNLFIFRVNKLFNITFFIEKFFLNFNFKKLSGIGFFNETKDIDGFLLKKLINFSNIFLLNNKYYIKNTNSLLNIFYSVNYLQNNLIFNSNIKVYVRNIYTNNIISVNSLEVREIINRVNNFFSNFK